MKRLGGRRDALPLPGRCHPEPNAHSGKTVMQSHSGGEDEGFDESQPIPLAHQQWNEETRAGTCHLRTFVLD